PREAVGAGPLGRPRPVAHRPGPPGRRSSSDQGRQGATEHMSTDKFPTVAEVLADLIADRPPEWVAACGLAAMVHITRDRATWTGPSCWDQPAARVLVAARSASALPEWWQQLVARMGCGHPSRTEDRQHLARLL